MVAFGAQTRGQSVGKLPENFVVGRVVREVIPIDGIRDDIVENPDRLLQ